MSFDPEYPIILEKYDSRWPLSFSEERNRILAAIGETRAIVEHVGSTAVPGLAAKPIIDILVGLPRLEEASKTIPALEGIGYQYIPEHERELPERRFLAKPRAKPRTHHIHMVEGTSAFWERHLLFRDYLRAHPDTAAEYEALKRSLALRFRENREAYTEGKNEFVRRVEEAARSSRGHAISPGLGAHATKP